MTEKFASVFPHLNERQRRLLAGAAARALGRGGLALVARTSGLHVETVSKGVAELVAGPSVSERVRAPGGGRKRLTETDPGLLAALEELVDPDIRDDPMSPLRWTCKSTRQLADALTLGGHPVSHVAVGTLLREQGYSLQANAKAMKGRRHPDRDAQFRYLNTQVKAHQGGGDPVVSVDTRKKELAGRQKCAADFADHSVAMAAPYGVDDVGADDRWVDVGSDHDTAAFAVDSIRRWWQAMGRNTYPDADRLLICADGGGSNGHRIRTWKTELAQLAGETGLTITVSHLLPGTSRWTKVEHRLFSNITMNWPGRPLTDHQTVVNLIAASTTPSGLRVQAELDTAQYQTKIKIKIKDAQLGDVLLNRHEFHGEWNYTLRPTDRS